MWSVRLANNYSKDAEDVRISFKRNKRRVSAHWRNAWLNIRKAKERNSREADRSVITRYRSLSYASSKLYVTGLTIGVTQGRSSRVESLTLAP